MNLEFMLPILDPFLDESGKCWCHIPTFHEDGLTPASYTQVAIDSRGFWGIPVHAPEWGDGALRPPETTS